MQGNKGVVGLDELPRLLADSPPIIGAELALIDSLGEEHETEYRTRRIARYESLLTFLRHYRNLGAGVVVDTATLTRGRDIRTLRALARASDLTVVPTTGLGSLERIPGHLRPGMEAWFRAGGDWPPGSFFSEGITYSSDRRYERWHMSELGAGIAAVRGRFRWSLRAAGVVHDDSGGSFGDADEAILLGAARAAAEQRTFLFVRSSDHWQRKLELCKAGGMRADRVVIALETGDTQPIGEEDPVAIASSGCYLAVGPEAGRLLRTVGERVVVNALPRQTEVLPDGELLAVSSRNWKSLLMPDEQSEAE